MSNIGSGLLQQGGYITPVSRFYFHYFNGKVSIDEEGVELIDIPAARVFAVDCARDMVCAAVKIGHLNLDDHIDVEDEPGPRCLW